jgi:excisionase family DNA binding protein
MAARKPVAPPSPYLTVDEVAEQLRITNGFVYKLCKRGDLDYVRVGTRKGIRITRTSFDAFVAAAGAAAG